MDSVTLCNTFVTNSVTAKVLKNKGLTGIVTFVTLFIINWSLKNKFIFYLCNNYLYKYNYKEFFVTFFNFLYKSFIFRKLGYFYSCNNCNKKV